MERGAGESQKDLGTYAIAYDACSEIANFKNQSGVRRLCYVVDPRGVSSHHVLIRAFGDAYYRREKDKARHSSFLRKGVSFRQRGKGRKKIGSIAGTRYLNYTPSGFD